MFTFLTPHVEQTTSKLLGKTKQLIVGSQHMSGLTIPPTQSLRINNKINETWHQILSSMFFVK